MSKSLKTPAEDSFVKSALKGLKQLPFLYISRQEM